jgi:hypothetical protein
MSCFLERRWGGSTEDPTVDQMRSALDELETDDDEHPDTWLTHDSGWTLTAYQTGVLIWGNDEEKVGLRHLPEVPRARILELWQLLARGDIAAVEREGWLAGGHPPLPIERLTAQQQAVAAALVAEHRAFYDSLGEERRDARCRREGCARGTVRFSTLCRPHHFENVRAVACPFSH